MAMIRPGGRGPIKRRLSNWFGPRGRVASNLRKGRRADQRAYAGENPEYYVRTGIKEYNKMFEHDIHQPIQEAIQTKGHARMLDISAGEGHALRDTKARFGDKVHTVATGLALPPKRVGVDDYKVMTLRGKRLNELGKNYNVISSVSGETQFMSAEDIAKNVLPRLAPGGHAFIDMGSLRMGPGGKVTMIEDDAIKTFEDKGFVVKKVLTRPPQEISGPVTLMVIERKK